MSLLSIRNKINELMSQFVTQIRGSAALRQIDLNTVSEIILIPLLSEVFGYKNLRNLNAEERTNYPAVDLADDQARVAFQITSTTDLAKVKATLQKFVDFEHYKKWDTLYIYILTEKQKSYSNQACQKIIGKLFSFNPEKNILDYRDLLSEVSKMQIDKARQIQTILEANFGPGSIPLRIGVSSPSESVFLNLLEIDFPKTMYIADLITDDSHTLKRRRRNWKKVGLSASRQSVQKELAVRNLKFGVDWECYEGKLITFHDLGDAELPLAHIVDPGTVTPLSPDEFTAQGENYERAFKSFLGFCMKQKLYHKGVQWQNEEDLFIFVPFDGQLARKVQWRGKKEAERVVFERTMKTEKPDEVLICKHLAFRLRYQRFGSKWYISIDPDWFFSVDGYHKSRYGADKVAWLKRKENNQQVFNHVRFFVDFLQNEEHDDLFLRWHTYRFLRFGKLVSFTSSPILNDSEWNVPPEAEDSSDQNMLLEL